MRLRATAGATFQGSSSSYGAGRAENTVLKRPPQLNEVKEIHAHMMETRNELQLFEKNTLMGMYVKCGSMVDAIHLFDSMPMRSVVSWNVMILGYAKQEEGANALELYGRMHHEGVQASDRTFVAVLKACSSLAALEEGKQHDGKFVKVGCLEKGRLIHAQTLKNGFEPNLFVGTSLVDMYAKCGSMEDAWHVFDKLPARDVVSWTAMILGHAQKEEGVLALELYAQMQQEGVMPNDQTFVVALKACCGLAALEDDENFLKGWCLEKGRAIHSQVVCRSSESNVFVGTVLVDMYAKCGSMEDAQRVFDVLPHRDVVSWNTMILGHAQKEEGSLALELYAQMNQEGVMPNLRTFLSALKACSSPLASIGEGSQADEKFVKVWCLESGRAMHSHAVKSRFDLHVYIGTTLVDMYIKCGSLQDARHVFDELPYRDVVCWTAMISGYADQEQNEQALKLYEKMQEQGLLANSFTYASILKAYGNTAALETGMGLHAEICSNGLDTTAVLATTLIDMYAKCGSLVDAQKMFDALNTRDVVTWNALVAGYARQGESELVLHLFEEMMQEGIQPNRLTLLSVLTVCNHVGRIDVGQKYFQAMNKHYGISPTIEHYNCMIDLLGRAGQVEEAVAMVEKMPFEPNFVSWLSVLGACQKWRNVGVGRHAFENAVRLDEKNASAYVLMSNIYAHAHMWEDHDHIQVMRKNAGARKKREQSWWTDIGGMVHTFVVGERRREDIYAKLKNLSVKMEEQGYMSHLDSIIWDIPDHENALCGHSEILAIACALIKTLERVSIRVVKNLQICDDCHKVIALISKIECRNIICRDAKRFHNFYDGKCSCGGYL